MEESADDQAKERAAAEGAQRVRRIADYGYLKGERWADYFPTLAAATRFHAWLTQNETLYEPSGIWPDGEPDYTWSVRYRIR